MVSPYYENIVMSLEKIVRGIWDEERQESRTAPFRAGLRLLSVPYGFVVAMRNRLYDRRFLKQERLSCPVISVGNITAGGTGKTPTVILLAKILKKVGRRPAVLSLGFGGSAVSPVSTVSDGKRILMGWREAGDEPVLIAAATPGVPVLTGPRRFITGRAAIEHFGADILILDDAFQHRALFRDLDILILDRERPFGNGHLLPRGPLREPSDALHRAHLLIRTGNSGKPEKPLPGHSGLPHFQGIHRPQELVNAATGQISTLGQLNRQKVCAFAAIGSPASFRRSLEELGAAVVSFRIFPDHHPYRPADCDALLRLASESGAERIVTTEKDGIRLADFPDFRAGCFLLRIGMEITPADAFAELLFSRVR